MSKFAQKHLYLFIIALTFFNYIAAKVLQRLWLGIFPDFPTPLAIALPWLLVAILPFGLSTDRSSLVWKWNQTRQHWKSIAVYSAIVLLGLGLFYLLGITKYFHSVRSPWVFFLVTPIVEELIFRGWIYTQLEKMKKFPVLGTALLFGLHHLQYFKFIPTPFAVFQVGYTFVLGLLLGKMRQKSGSVYLPILLHILINWATVSW